MINPFSPLTSKIFGGIAVASLLFSGIQTWRVNSLKKDNAQYELKLAISNRSIETLENSLAKSRESILAAQQLQKSKQAEALAALKKAKTESRSLYSQIESIKADNTTSDVSCPTPQSILSAEGL